VNANLDQRITDQLGASATCVVPGYHIRAAPLHTNKYACRHPSTTPTGTFHCTTSAAAPEANANDGEGWGDGGIYQRPRGWQKRAADGSDLLSAVVFEDLGEMRN
jgi:hypothetical protein